MGMLTQADRRVPRGAGFHLTEVLVTAMVIGLLASVAIPSYRAFQGRAHTAAAEAAVRSVLPAVEAYVLHNGDYGFDRTVDGTPAKSAAEALRATAAPCRAGSPSRRRRTQLLRLGRGRRGRLPAQGQAGGSVVKSSSGC